MAVEAGHMQSARSSVDEGRAGMELPPIRPAPAAEAPAHGDGRRLEQAFTVQARRTPACPALLHRRHTLSYGELDAQSNRLAHYLRASGLTRETPVAVMMERTPALIVALLAILKAGGAYVPIDPAYPADRRAFMLDDSRAALLLTDGKPAPAAFDGQVRDMIAERPAIAASPAVPLSPPGDHRDLAAILYTSGSTGAPKGVMLEHSAARLIDWLAGHLPAGSLARVAATSSICFDPSMVEVFAPLSVGGCIILKQNLLEPFGDDERPTLIQGVPSVLDQLAGKGAVPGSVRVINIGGEALPAAVARRVYRRSQVERVYNHYGPTEATVVAAMALVDRDAADDPPLGVPVAGARLHLLDEQGAPVAAGRIGEIHIAGDGLARGYWNRPDLTEARFVAEPGRPGSRMYRTGDLARLTEQGALMFVGRRERQVKVRGCRVELGEVEQAIRNVPGVSAAAATVVADAGRHDRLVAFVETAGSVDIAAARAELARWLPRYMLPSRIIVVAALPRNGVGKVDYAAIESLLPEDNGDEPAPAGPDGALQTIIAREFAGLLALPSVAPDDDFFDLGGDSLSAFQLATALEERFGRAISPSIVAQASTVRALAGLLEATALHDGEHLCLLAPGERGPPVFCLPDVSGEPFSFAAFAEQLDGRPVYGLSPDPLADALAADPDLRLLTAAYADAVARVQPDGPCVVAGYSFGGAGAVDLAGALERSGRRVTLILIDAFLAQGLTAPSRLVPWLARHGLAYWREEGGQAVMGKMLASHRLPWGRAVREAPAWISSRRRRLADAMIAAMTRYRPAPFAGPTIMIGAGERGAFERLLDHDGRQGWGRWLVGDVVARTIATTHLGLMRYPDVAHTAALVESELGKVARRERGGSI